MKSINIFGRKMPMVAILMALLVVGTASAAVFNHYATLDGNIEMTAPVFVTGVDIGGSGDLTFGSPASFEISNDGDIPVIVVLETTVLYTGYGPEDDLDGIYVDYDVIESGDDIEEGEVLVPPGGLTVHVNFDTDEFVYPGTYNVQVEVMTYEGGETYENFGGSNEMETLDLLQKSGNPDWIPTGNEAEVSFVPMGNDFYYELYSGDLEEDVDYTLIYYADKVPDRFAAWGGNNPGAIIATGTANIDGELAISGHINLGMSLPHPDDGNAYLYDYSEEFGGIAHGAKLWLVPSSNINTAFDSETQLVDGLWGDVCGRIFMENNLIQYTDTNQ